MCPSAFGISVGQCLGEGCFGFFEGGRVFGKGFDGLAELGMVVGEEEVVAEVGGNDGGGHFRRVVQESLLGFRAIPRVATPGEIGVALLDPRWGVMESPASHQAFVVDVGEFVCEEIGQGAFVRERLSVVSDEPVPGDISAAEKAVRQEVEGESAGFWTGEEEKAAAPGGVADESTQTLAWFPSGYGFHSGDGVRDQGLGIGF